MNNIENGALYRRVHARTHAYVEVLVADKVTLIKVQ